MTSGRDDARKRRGRGRGDGPSDEEIGWLAELRQASEEGRTGRHTGETPMHPELLAERRAKARPSTGAPGRHTAEVRISPDLTGPAPFDETPTGRHTGEIRIPRDAFTEPTRPASFDGTRPGRHTGEIRIPRDAFTEPTHTDLPRTDRPRTEPTRSDLPRTDLPRTELPRSDRPRTEPTRSDLPRRRREPPVEPPLPRTPPLSTTVPTAMPTTMPTRPTPSAAVGTAPETPSGEHPGAGVSDLLNARRPAPHQRTEPPSPSPSPSPSQSPSPSPSPSLSRSRGYTPYTPLQDYRGRDLPARIGDSHGRVSGMQGIEMDATTLMAPLGARRKRQAKQVTMLRTATFVLLVLAIVGAPAAFFVIREFTRDPVFVELDNLNVPAWAAGKHTDAAVGSRWCIEECRSRQRTWESARGPEETNRAYVAALKRAGWTSWNVPQCPAPGVDGVETCWQRDEYVLDLWVRAAVCETKGVRPTVAPSKPPSTAPSPSPPPAVSPANVCPGAIATIKVYNRISYQPGP